VAISLGTRRFREAEHLAAVADRAFEDACMTAVETARPSRMAEGLAQLTTGQTAAEIAAELEAAVAFVEARARMDGPGAKAAARRGLALERAFQGDAPPRTGLLRDTSPELAVAAERAMTFLAEEMFPPVATSTAAEPVPVEPVQAAVAPSPVASVPALAPEAVSAAAEEDIATTAREAISPKEESPAPVPAKPLASAVLVEFAAHRERKGHPLRMVDQACSTARRFIAFAGDKPLDEYGRGDIGGFAEDVLRHLPRNHGKPRKDRDRSPAEIIEEADAKEERTGKAVPRLSEVTVQRQVSELSAFFLFGVNRRPQLLRIAEHAELFKRHDFGEVEGERDQRKPWPDADLKALSKSPLYQGCDPLHRAHPGKDIPHDALFWLPLMELFQGARLEEMADLYARDIGDDHRTPYFDIREHHERADGRKRRLKTKPSKRKVPIHPVLLKMGFLEYVRWRAPNPGDPVFPELLPQGRDGRRGPRFTRAFGYYRRRAGLYREGMDGHALRHNANTRLRDAITDEQQRRHVNYMLGWGGGKDKDDRGEGERRYDQGPPPRESVKTLALLQYPELEFSHLYGWGPLGRR
jgi:hypothetical protein